MAPVKIEQAEPGGQQQWRQQHIEDSQEYSRHKSNNTSQASKAEANKQANTTVKSISEQTHRQRTPTSTHKHNQSKQETHRTTNTQTNRLRKPATHQAKPKQTHTQINKPEGKHTSKTNYTHEQTHMLNRKEVLPRSAADPRRASRRWAHNRVISREVNKRN